MVSAFIEGRHYPPPPLSGSAFYLDMCLDVILQRAKDTIFHRAAKEVSAVLENNVYSGFMATEEYKHIQDQRFDVVEQVEDG